jgi:hypothetical protein
MSRRAKRLRSSPLSLGHGQCGAPDSVRLSAAFCPPWFYLVIFPSRPDQLTSGILQDSHVSATNDSFQKPNGLLLPVDGPQERGARLSSS